MTKAELVEEVARGIELAKRDAELLVEIALVEGVRKIV